MISAVTTPQSSPSPQASVRELAAAGYFRAIALWLNEPLAQQGVFVQVQADRPGCLRLTVEFERPPIRDRLLRFLCHRIWLLNSELIEGIYVVARPVGRRRILWQQRIRIVTPALKRRKSVVRVAHPAEHNSPLPPQIRQQQRPPQRHLSSQTTKTLRAFLLTGSAVAAFLVGCLLEVVATGPGPALPSFSAQSPSIESPEAPTVTADSHDPTANLEATTIDYQATAEPSAEQPVLAGGNDNSALLVAERPTVVDAALEPVAVIEHHQPTAGNSDDVTLLFGGDLALDEVTYGDIDAEGGIFAEVEDYFNADVSMLTLGSPLATAATTLEEELHDVSRPEAVELLVESGVDIVNLTNESLMEYGVQGLTETLTALDSKGLYRVGAGRNEMEARRPEIIDVKGKRIAYLSYSMGGDEAAFGDRGGFNAQDMPEIVEDIQALRDEVDWIVVNYRWMEHVTEEPNFMQTNLARLAIDQGADVVVGYHPNVIQGAEIYKGRPIAYSLGDFVFDADAPLNDQDSAVLKVSLKGEQMRVEFVPVRVKDSLPVALDKKEGEAVLERIHRASTQFEQPMESPMVLDLNADIPAPPTDVDPGSSFASPQDQDILPVDPFEDEPTETITPTDKDDASDGNPDDLDKPATDESAEPATKPLPETLNLQEQFGDDLLQEWGPKPSSPDQEFKPVPENRQQTTAEEIDAQLPLGLLRRLRLPFEPTTNSATPSQDEVGAVMEDTWSESVPESPNVVPTTPAPEAAAPSMAPIPEPPAEVSAPATEVTPETPSAPATATTSTPAKLPNRLVPDAPQLGVEPIPEPQLTAPTPEVEPAGSQPETTQPEATQPEVQPIEEQSSLPANPEAITPHGEPLVGPLGSMEGVVAPRPAATVEADTPPAAVAAEPDAAVVAQVEAVASEPTTEPVAPSTVASEPGETVAVASQPSSVQPTSGDTDAVTAARAATGLSEVAVKSSGALPQKQESSVIVPDESSAEAAQASETGSPAAADQAD
jgi:poly-gamma-glutamate capsule biosynthesis protein CapA/YwtB (metallophosphatase superfamily)